jgi:hypothetical protein
MDNHYQIIGKKIISDLMIKTELKEFIFENWFNIKKNIDEMFKRTVDHKNDPIHNNVLSTNKEFFEAKMMGFFDSDYFEDLISVLEEQYYEFTKKNVSLKKLMVNKFKKPECLNIQAFHLSLTKRTGKYQ